MAPHQPQNANIKLPEKGTAQIARDKRGSQAGSNVVPGHHLSDIFRQKILSIHA